MEPIKIVDIIIHQNKYRKQLFIVVNRDPEFKYKRKGKYLIAEDSGFFGFYKYDRPSPGFYAFAGRKFDIPMTDGSVEKAYGQWWDDVPNDYKPRLYHLGYGTKESLADCNVFSSVYCDKNLVNTWLNKNNPSNNYHKYDPKNHEYGEHTIESPWDESDQ